MSESTKSQLKLFGGEDSQQTYMASCFNLSVKALLQKRSSLMSNHKMKTFGTKR